MPFATRNAYYLRISATTVLPLYIYLDERHVEWMSDRVLQHVLADLRPLIIPKLNAEADAQLGSGSAASKRGTLDVHRGDTYQFGYFLRGTEPHAVLVKSRLFTAAPPVQRRTALPPPQPETNKATSSKGQRARKAAAQKAGQKRKPKPRPKGKGKARAVEDEEDAISISSEGDDAGNDVPAETMASRRPKRTKTVADGGYREQDEDEDMADVDATPEAGDNFAPQDDTAPIVPKREETEPSLSDLPAPPQSTTVEDIDDDPQPPSAMDVELIDDEEEPKPKPVLKLAYHGFTIHGRCLCVIVEPWPPVRAGTRAPSVAPSSAPRASSIAPPEFVASVEARRERTPLFLPEYDKEPTPAPSGSGSGAGRVLPPVPLFGEEPSDEEEGDMVLFSQILRSAGEHPPGIAEDDDEIDGAVFFGDADEMRELG
ncbi:uncharacterized protein BXZ73DRAFT_40044 [Epithele typhae]|uniref:uncharacterized protein n=1 Tax=Epithele typhae TaxID=378194 RepID=UPI002008E08E|nr:uncharacterized protein BXZ73DRAFT_40044 [Epithele typhae]KAH9943498.1 hypothetical protein BXZ73DRAFT_40044 [Epithele typhae]